MAYNSTIAGQIQRIQDATNRLRTKGIDLGLKVLDGEALNNDHRLNDVADAFESLVLQTGKYSDPVEIPIEIKTTTDGYTLLEYPNKLPAGYYSSPINLVATLKDDTDTPYVLNIQHKEVTVSSVSGDGTTASPYGVTILPDSGFNYMNRVDVQLQAAAFKMPTTEAGSFSRPIAYTNNASIATVTFELNKKGWINSNYEAVLHVSKPSWKRNSQSVTDVMDATGQFVKVNPYYRTVLNLDKGLLPNGFQLTIPSLSDITNITTDNAATVNDVIKDKKFYVNGELLTGTMPDYRISGSQVSYYGENSKNNTLSFKVLPGAYSANSIIATDIVYNPAIETTSYSSTTQAPRQLTLNAKSGKIKVKSGYYSEDVELTTTAKDSKFNNDGWSNHKVSFTCTDAGWVAADTKLEYAIQHSTLEYELKQTSSTTDTDDLDVAKDGFWEFTPDSGTYYSHVKISPKKIIELLELI